MRKFYLLSVFLLAISSIPQCYAQIAKPIYGKAKHYQLRNMEIGPWEFHPESYFYSWYNKTIDLIVTKVNVKLPGLGARDKGPAGIGGGDGYVTDYAPNKTRRIQLLTTAILVKNLQKDRNKLLENVEKQTAIDIADRMSDYVSDTFSSQLDSIKTRFWRSCTFLRSNYPKVNIEPTILDHSRLVSNLEDIKKAYEPNGNKLKAYREVIYKLDSITKHTEKAVRFALLLKNYENRIKNLKTKQNVELGR